MPVLEDARAAETDVSAVQPTVGRLSVTYLLCLMAGIGGAITIARGIEWLRFRADQFFYGIVSPAELDGRALLVAVIYGLCLTTFVFAVRSGRFWESPGKILSLLFASMCVLNWTLDAIAGFVTTLKIDPSIKPRNPIWADIELWMQHQQSGEVLGIWYREFAPCLGYLVALPLLGWVLWKTRRQRCAWWLVWLGFLVFDLLVIADMHFDASVWLSPSWQGRYFDLALAIPMSMLTIALGYTLVRHRDVDWWTAIVAVPLLSLWSLVWKAMML